MNTPKNIYILLDSNAVSICNYGPTKVEGEKTVLNLNTLKQLIEYANSHEYIVSFVHGDVLPETYYDALALCKRQANIMGLRLFEKLSDVPNVTVSLDAGEYIHINRRKLSENLNRSAILHFSRETIGFLTNAVKSLLRICRRIIIVCDDASYFQTEICTQYENALKEISDILKYEIAHGKLTEINVLTDAVLIADAHPCPAGVSSFAFSASGKLYPCPAFIDSPEFELPFTYEAGIYNKNERIFSLRPVCRDCTQYHCSRCAFINNQFTKELCIPPYETCEIVEIENEMSEYIFSPQNVK